MYGSWLQSIRDVFMNKSLFSNWILFFLISTITNIIHCTFYWNTAKRYQELHAWTGNEDGDSLLLLEENSYLEFFYIIMIYGAEYLMPDILHFDLISCRIFGIRSQHYVLHFYYKYKQSSRYALTCIIELSMIQKAP